MTKLISVTVAHQREEVLINIDSIVKITIIDYGVDAKSKIKLKDNEELQVMETLDELKVLCNS